MSDQATKIKEGIKDKVAELKTPQTFETAKAENLTENERKALSREKILNWYKAKKYEKLKGLQAALVGATYSEREAMKKIIIENTKGELAKHEEIIEEERNRRSERFAEEIIGVAAGIGNIDVVIKKYEKQQDDENLFFATLKDYTGKEKDREIMQKMANNPQIKSLIGELKPAETQELELAMAQGDVKKVRQMLAAASGGRLSESQINTLFATAVFKTPGFEKKTGIGVVDNIINFVNVARNVGHLTVLDRAAKDLKMPFIFVIHLSTKTLRDIQTMDDNLQRNKYLIENKREKSLVDAERLEFIKRVSEMRAHIEGKSNGAGIREAFSSSLTKYLQEKKELTDEDRIKIINEAKFEDLRLIQIFDLVYGSPEDREKWFIKSLSRIPTMIRAHKQIFGEQRYIRQTYKEYHMRRIKEWAINGFTQNARKWQMGGILKDINDIENMVSKGPKFSETEFDNLFKRADKYDFNVDNINEAKKTLSSEMLEHDNIVKRYHALVRQATNIMTDEAKKVINAGKSIELVQRGAGEGFMTKNLQQLPHVSDKTLESLFGDVSKLDRTKITGGDLVAAYSKKLVDLKGMQEISRARFAALADVIDSKVMKPFSEGWGAKLEFAKGRAERGNIVKKIDEIQDMVRPSRSKYYAKKFGLPAIIVGAEMYYLITGKAKTNEVVWDLGEAAAGFVPFLGTSLDIRGAIKGSTLSGKTLSTKERFMYAGFAAIGVVADVATLVGGIGLGLRAGIGGMRTGRKAVQAGKALDTANAMRQAAYTSDIPWLQRQIASGASYFSKANRAEAATEAIVAARAMDQANMISSLSHKYGKLDNIEDVAAAMKKADAADLGKLQSLHKMYEGAGGAIDYMKIMEKYGHGIKVPAGMLGRAWYSTLAGFKKMKAQLLSIGISADVLRTYENTFDAVKAAEAAKASAVKDLADLYRAQHLERVKQAEAFAELSNTGSNLGKAEKQYAKLVEQAGDANRGFISAGATRTRLEKQYKELEKAAKAGKKISQDEIDAAKKLYEKADANWGKAKENLYSLNAQKLAEGKNIATENMAWKTKLDSTGKNLMDMDIKVLSKEEAVRSAEFAIHNANATRSLIQAEMMQKATSAAHIADNLAIVTRNLQRGGIVMGGIWFLTGFTKGPAEQYQALKEYGGKGAAVAGKTINELYLEDHSGQPAIDQMVEERVGKVTRKKAVMGYIEEAKQKGEDPAVALARKWDDEAVQEVAKTTGYFEKVQDLLAKGKVKIEDSAAAIKESAVGDVSGKVGEKLSG